MKKVIIVGAGITGLIAGVYARQSGFDTTIFEKHSIPGGNSTSWKRKGYFFEGGMHWLIGSSEKVGLHRVWREVGALQENNPIYNRDPFLTYMGKDATIHLYRDPEKLKNHLLSVAPQDEKAIRALIKDIKAAGGLSAPVLDVKGVRAKYKSAPPLAMLGGLLKALPVMGKLKNTTAGEYADRFTHPGIRAMMHNLVGTDDFGALSTVFTLASLASGDAGYPKGGSLRMAQNIAQTYTSLGGELTYNARVDKVMVENGRACGVMVDGKAHLADAVIVTVDALTAIDHLFDAPLHEGWMDQMRSEIKPLNCTFIGLGVKADLSHLPENLLYSLDQPLTLVEQTYHSFGFYNYAAYQGYAPEGGTVLTCPLMKDTYDTWKVYQQQGIYKEKKAELAQAVIEALAQTVPETRGKVEVWDVATPLTYERYCATHRGSWMSIMGTGKQRQSYPLKSESIQGLYFAGQRMMPPGGLPVAASTGRQVVQHVCGDEDTVFQADY